MSRKLHLIPTGPVDANSTLIGVQDVSSTFTSRRYLIADLIAYLKSFFIGNSTTVPTITLGAGAGSGATANIVRGNDTFFTIHLVAGTSAAANTTVANINYGTAKAATPNVLWCPSDVNSNSIVGSNQAVLIFTVDQNDCRITSGSSGLSNGASYIWTIFSS